jgi:peptidase E
MQTRIILHGGNVNRVSESNDSFFRDIISGVENDPVKILCVYFARPEHRWDDSYEEDQYPIRRIAKELDREVETMIATYDLEDFTEKVAECDIIFINGGMKGHLKNVLLEIGLERFRQMIEGKTLVGISAGANILSKYYYSMVIDGIREGTGFLDIKLLTHYSDEELGHLNALKAYGEDLSVVTVAEEDYVIIQQR